MYVTAQAYTWDMTHGTVEELSARVLEDSVTKQQEETVKAYPFLPFLFFPHNCDMLSLFPSPPAREYLVLFIRPVSETKQQNSNVHRAYLIQDLPPSSPSQAKNLPAFCAVTKRRSHP